MMADMLRIQQEAKAKGFDSAEFYISAPKGVFKAKWLDAYFGLFTIPALSDGFLNEKVLPPGCEGFWTEEEAKTHNEPFHALFKVLSGMQDDEEDAA
ncbi:hypothetical protein NKH72_24235 [Mesorhizobium sp. M0955]|uniref:hypothetical protein n=1 Tax=Mesorhizobium sp. M0955 TaxID=2957033 RepID=UPI00333A1E6D